jgi:TRAP-type C4-dicarboxylate transport system permease small subunit
MVRRFLDGLYLASAVLGALCFVGVLLWILYQLGGQFFPYIPRSADEFAGYCMAASAFLALAYTFNANEHIRVTLVVDRLHHRLRHRVACLAILLALLLSVYLAWHMTKLTWLSWQLDERSAGLIALPLWIPQSAMAFGAVVFVMAVLERAISVWGGGPIESVSTQEEVIRADR